MTTNLVLNNAPQELDKLEIMRSEIAQISEMAMTQRILDVATKDAALAVGGQVKRMRAAIEATRKQITGPMQDKVKQVIAFASTLDAPLERAESHIRAQATSYAASIAEQQRKEQAKIMLEKQRIEAERQAQLRASAVFNDVPEDHIAQTQVIEQQAKAQRIDTAIREREVKAVGVKGTREEWSFEIIDRNLVPDQYWIIDESLLRNAVRVVKLREIPGLRIYSETKVSLARY